MKYVVTILLCHNAPIPYHFFGKTTAWPKYKKKSVAIKKTFGMNQRVNF